MTPGVSSGGPAAYKNPLRNTDSLLHVEQEGAGSRMVFRTLGVTCAVFFGAWVLSSAKDAAPPHHHHHQRLLQDHLVDRSPLL
ncbi:hypothetical protein OJAV_G00092940 [Oryzias javanicus]|uniref:Uncharacterized protein n=1 Tax=Oryzias javanicus TaxID=123683 RepID=A0A437D1F4_ORYJA|nr:hypothetical protein OJAV_G00092940 [Oryzias javanicus]